MSARDATPMTQTSKYLHADLADYADLVDTVQAGRCVTTGIEYTGKVAQILMSCRSDVRYRLVETGRVYSNGRAIEPIVHAPCRYVS